MKLMSEVFKWFLYITTGILIVTAIMFSLVGEETIPVNTLWKILLIGILTTGVTVCFRPWRDWRYAGFALHYIALCVVMVVCGCMFGWINFNMSGVLCMMVDVAAVYLIAFVAYCLVDKKQAEEINKRLREKYQEEE